MGQAPSGPQDGAKLRVIGAGMSRTGTKSLNEALRILLDGPVHDSGVQSLGGTKEQQRLWLDIMELAPQAKSHADRKHLEWLIAKILEGYTATMDSPANLLVPEILSVFPDAVVICTTRDPDSWFKSIQLTKELTNKWYLPFFVSVLPDGNVFPRWNKLRKRMLAWRLGHEELRVDSLRYHEEQLRKVIPPEKLFFYRCSDGWEPLCKILGVPVPDVPFPHNNKPDEARNVFRGIIIAGATTWFFLIIIWMALIFAASKVLSHKQLKHGINIL